MAEGKITSLSSTLVAQLQAGGTSRSTISGADVNAWFGPSQPLQPVAPKGVGGRQWDYPFGVNLNYIPRGTEPVSFADLRALADNLPLLRAVIETRKDQIASLPWAIRATPDEDVPKLKPQATAAQKSRAKELKAFLRKPDRVLPYETWLRALLEDMLVCDAATIYPRPTLGGDVYSLDVIDGATIKPLLDIDGRRPQPPDPAFQQILKGIVAADFTADELLYLPRNVRSSKIYGFSPVEQIVMTANIALRRDTSTLEYYRSGTVPDSFGTLPKEWTPDQIKSFQDYFDGLMAGNTQARRGMRFMPSDFKYEPAREPPLKDVYDEWLARVVCYAFSVPVTPFVSQVNRATAETQRLQASQEGLVPLQQWIKNTMDHVVQVLLGAPDLEYAWMDGDTIDPLEQMQELTGYVAVGGMSRDELRDKLGLPPIEDGSGKDYTSNTPVNPARLPTPEEQAAQQQHELSMIQAKKPEPGDGAGEPPQDNSAQKFAKYSDSEPRDAHGRWTSGSIGPEEHARIADEAKREAAAEVAAEARAKLKEKLKAEAKAELTVDQTKADKHEAEKKAFMSAAKEAAGGVALGAAAAFVGAFAPEIAAVATVAYIADSVAFAMLLSAGAKSLDHLSKELGLNPEISKGVLKYLETYEKSAHVPQEDGADVVKRFLPKMADEVCAAMTDYLDNSGQDAAKIKAAKHGVAQAHATFLAAVAGLPGAETDISAHPLAASKLAKEEGFDEVKHPRDEHGRFAPKGSAGGDSSPKRRDSRPRDANGMFIRNGGTSRGYTAAAKRKRVVEGVRNAAERAVVGAVLFGGAAIATAVFKPKSIPTLIALGLAQAVGASALGQAAVSASSAVMDFLHVPKVMQQTVHEIFGAAMSMGGDTSFRDVTDDAPIYGQAPAAQPRLAAPDVVYGQAPDATPQITYSRRGADGRYRSKNPEKFAKADAEHVDWSEVIDAIQDVLYQAGQDTISRLKDAAAEKAGPDREDALKAVRDGLDAALDDFLDRVDDLSDLGEPEATGPDTDVSDHPVAAQKLAKVGEGSVFAAGVMFLTSDNRVLYLKRTGDCPHTGTWCMPGGKVDPGETAREAAVRESDEEAGVLKSIALTPDMLGEPIALNTIDDEGRQFACYLHRVPAPFDVTLQAEESSDYAWAPFDEPPQPAHPSVTPILEMARALLPARKLAKGANFDVLEPMWQSPTNEKRSTKDFRRIMTAAFAKAAPKVAAYVRGELVKFASADQRAKFAGSDLRKADPAAGVPLDDLSDAAGPLADVAERAADEVAYGASARIGLGDDDGFVDRVSTKAVAQARARSAELVGMRWDDDAGEFVPNPNPKYAVTDSTRDMIRTIIADGLDENLSADDIADRIESSVAFSPERASLVAMTEIARVNSDAALVTYGEAREAGVTVKKKWIVAATDVCDDCTLNAKQGPIDLDEEFQSGDQAPPQHPNCRCAVAPVVYRKDETDDAEESDD